MSNLKFLVFSILLCFSACQSQNKNAAPNNSNNSSFQNISVAEFKAKMNSPNAVILDVRTPAEIAEGKIAKAMELDFRNPDFSGKLDELDKEKSYLIYCKSGGRSSNTCKMMSKKGFKNLYNLEGGYTAWSQEH